MGWNIGLLYDISDATRLGFAYRSNVEHALTGNVDFTMNANLQGVLNTFAPTLFTDTGISAGVDLPETVSLSLLHTFSPKWKILADVTWTKWSRFDKIVIDFSNPIQDSSTTPENWEDVLRYSLGVNYQADDKWTYRAGLALDESPIPSAEDRTARLPGSDRTWLSLGFGYKMSSTSNIDVGYTHVFFDDAPINNTDASFGHTLTGSYDVSADIFSAQYSWKF
jgi:long-chain fatty acid transport protein